MTAPTTKRSGTGESVLNKKAVDFLLAGTIIELNHPPRGRGGYRSMENRQSYIQKGMIIWLRSFLI